MKISERLGSWVGQQVVVEGTFPIPIGPGKIAYAPARGKLISVFDDGFELLEDGATSVFVTENVRSVTLFEQKAVVGVTRGKIITGPMDG